MGLIIGLTDPKRYVAHYTKIRTAIDHILPNRSLRIGSFARTNDPKESKSWEFTPGTNNPGTDLMKYGMGATGSMSRALTAELKGRARVICFCSDRGPLTGFHINDIFNRGFARPRMWAQYAENHTGVCLVFDREALNKRIVGSAGPKCDVVSGPVIYHDRSILPRWAHDPFGVNVDALEQWGLRKYAREHLKRYYRQLFFEKMTDWRDEEEYRLVVWRQTIDDFYVDYGDALKAVIFGENIRPDFAEEVMGLTQDDEVEWQALKWSNSAPWYDFANLKYHREIRKSGGWGQPPLPRRSPPPSNL